MPLHFSSLKYCWIMVKLWGALDLKPDRENLSPSYASSNGFSPRVIDVYVNMSIKMTCDSSKTHRFPNKQRSICESSFGLVPLMDTMKRRELLQTWTANSALLQPRLEQRILRWNPYLFSVKSHTTTKFERHHGTPKYIDLKNGIL